MTNVIHAHCNSKETSAVYSVIYPCYANS